MPPRLTRHTPTPRTADPHTRALPRRRTPHPPSHPPTVDKPTNLTAQPTQPPNRHPVMHFLDDYDKHGRYTGFPCLGIEWQV